MPGRWRYTSVTRTPKRLPNATICCAEFAQILNLEVGVQQDGQEFLKLLLNQVRRHVSWRLFSCI